MMMMKDTRSNPSKIDILFVYHDSHGNHLAGRRGRYFQVAVTFGWLKTFAR